LNFYKSNPVNQFLNAEEIKINQIKYDKYSFEKDPADKLFKSFYGEKWTKKYIDFWRGGVCCCYVPFFVLFALI